MITSYIAKAADTLLFPLLELPPLVVTMILSFTFSLIVLLWQRKVFSNKNVRELKIRLDEIREKVVKLKNRNQEEMDKIMSEMLRLNARIMKESLKVSVLSLLLGIVLLSWISFHYSGYYLKSPLPYVKNINLVYFYVILSLVIGIVIGKFLEVR